MTQNGHADSRERAKRLILAGCVKINGTVIQKAAFEVEGEVCVEVQEERFVGRGGEKLERALSLFGIDPSGMRALDIGASTGGFTQCLLLHGAAHVVALDAGCDQLHPALRADERVTNIEKYNARNLSAADVGTFDLAVMDVSFISQTYILPRLPEVLSPCGAAITLIKPQFEAGRAALNKKGLVKSPKDRIFAISRVLLAAREVGLYCHGLAPSPIKGGDGNEEYLAYFTRQACDMITDDSIEKTVKEGKVCR